MWSRLNQLGRFGGLERRRLSRRMTIARRGNSSPKTLTDFANVPSWYAILRVINAKLDDKMTSFGPQRRVALLAPLAVGVDDGVGAFCRRAVAGICCNPILLFHRDQWIDDDELDDWCTDKRSHKSPSRLT